jgi:hypothetical protein
MIILRQSNFSEEKNEKAAKAGKETGMATGALGVGVLGGLGVHKLAKNSDKYREKLAERIEKGLEGQRSKYFKKWKEAEGKEAQKFGAKVDRAMNRKDSLKNLSSKIEKVTKPVAEFAKTKGGKWAIIGGTTAALGGAAYLGAKKKDKER